jgi:hypothetical protein
VTAREDKARLAALVATCEGELGAVAGARRLGDALAATLGGELGLAWRVLVLRSAIAAPPDGDAVRELYGELVDRYRDDPAALAVIKPIGAEIRKLEAAGELPSTMVARSKRRPTKH